MRQINPIYIVLLLFVLLFFVLFQLILTKTTLHERQNDFQKTKEMVHNIVGLRDNWDNEKRTKNSLSRILRSSMLQGSDIIRRDKRGLIELRSDAMDSKSASYLISRLLNEPFTIKSMKILRLDKEQASFYAEIRL